MTDDAFADLNHKYIDYAGRYLARKPRATHAEVSAAVKRQYKAEGFDQRQVRLIVDWAFFQRERGKDFTPMFSDKNDNSPSDDELLENE